MINGYVSLKTVINKLYRDLGINAELNEAHITEWVAETLEKIGSYYQYEQVKECLDIVEGKVKLPCNFHRLIDISYNSQTLSWANNGIASTYGCEGCTIPTCCSEYNFYINDSYIITNITETNNNIVTEDPKLCVAYLGIPVDEDGYPLVPDDVYFLEACAKYVTYMLDYREWRKGNMADKVFQKSESDYLFYVNSARGSANMPNAAQLENLKNVWVRLIPQQNAYNSFFKDVNKQEKRYRH